MNPPSPQAPRPEDKFPQWQQPIPTAPLENHSFRKMIAQIYNSFYYAYEGLIYTLLTQRNMRFHFFAALGVMMMSIILALSPIEKAFLFIVISFVFSMEVLNTCIETFVDIVTPTYHRLAKVAKDSAAAAVLVVSIGSVMSAGYLLIPRFFNAVFQPGFVHTMAKDLVAMAVVMGAIVIVWMSRLLRFIQIPILVLCSAVAGFGIAFLCYAGRDVLSFCAMIFFSFLLYTSISKKHSSAWPFFGHIAGAVLYIASLYI
jgi:diacylglycerol kinase (ATP)